MVIKIIRQELLQALIYILTQILFLKQVNLHLEQCINIAKQVKLFLRFDFQNLSGFIDLNLNIISLVTIDQHNEGKLDFLWFQLSFIIFTTHKKSSFNTLLSFVPSNEIFHCYRFVNQFLQHLLLAVQHFLFVCNLLSQLTLLKLIIDPILRISYESLMSSL